MSAMLSSHSKQTNYNLRVVVSVYSLADEKKKKKKNRKKREKKKEEEKKKYTHKKTNVLFI